MLPATHAIADVFTEEVRLVGGNLSRPFNDGENVFLRAVLPDAREARAGDRFHGGVALRTKEHEILVHPYVFRQVCRNGAIIAQAVETRRIERVGDDAWDDAVGEVLGEVRQAVRACASADAFASAFIQIRSAVDAEADLALQLAPLIERLPPSAAGEMLAGILGRFHQDRDRSAYGLMNAVTSLARDTYDAESRWRLEEMGGAIPAGLSQRPRFRAPDRAAALLPV
jgi:hypothetical protein